MNANFFNYTEILLTIITVSVVFIAAALLLGFYYILSILRAIRRISNKAEQVTNDVSELRDNLIEHGLHLSAFGKFLRKLRRTLKKGN